MIRRQLVLGAWLGFLVLGLGGRLVMRWIALATGAPGSFSLGGTLTVVAAGTAAGVAGALMYASSGAIAKRFPSRERIVRLALFVLLLALVTARGLRGTPPAPAASFWPLVALYAGLFMALEFRSRRKRSAATGTGTGERDPRGPLRFIRAPGNLR